MSNVGDFRTTASVLLGAAKDTQLKVIDVSDTPLKPNVLRQGKQVPAVALDPKIVGTIISPDLVIPPALAPRVVAQSIPPGTKIARGASVDISLAPRTTIPVDVIVGFHADFAGRNVGMVVESILVNRQVLDAVLDFETAAEVPQATRALITETLAANDVAVNDADPARSFEVAFHTLKGAAAFK